MKKRKDPYRMRHERYDHARNARRVAFVTKQAKVMATMEGEPDKWLDCQARLVNHYRREGWPDAKATT